MQREGLSSFPFPCSPLFCVCIRLFRNVHAIIMGGLSYSSYIVELFSIFYFLHASASCQINTMRNKVRALSSYFKRALSVVSLIFFQFPNLSHRISAPAPQSSLFKFCTFSSVSFHQTLTVSNLPLPGIQHLISSAEKK